MAKLKDTTIVGGGSDKTLQIVNPQLQEVITIDSEGMITKPESSNIGIGLKNSATPHIIKNIETAISIVSFIDFLANTNICLII